MDTVELVDTENKLTLTGGRKAHPPPSFQQPLACCVLLRHHTNVHAPFCVRAWEHLLPFPLSKMQFLSLFARLWPGPNFSISVSTWPVQGDLPDYGA